MRIHFLSDVIAAFAVVGTLRNYDGDGKENVKKAIGLMSKTTILHVHHALLYIFFAAPAQLRGEITQFYLRTGTARL